MRSKLTARFCVLAYGVIFAIAGAAYANGPPADRGTNTAPGLNRDLLPDTANRGNAADDDGDQNNDGASLGRTVVLGGLRSGAADSFLRFSNLGNTAGRAEVTLVDAESGDEIATWESASIPAHGAIQVSLGDLAGEADIAEDLSYVAIVRAGFKGHVQHVAWSAGDGVVTDMTACRRLETPTRGLGYVSGPGAADLEGVVRIVNEGAAPRTVVLALHGAATGNVMGSWTSPDIAGNGADSGPNRCADRQC
jgi:hypothetical protein